MTDDVRPEASPTKTLLRVEDLHVSFRTDGAPVRAVNGISYDLAPGEILAIVGESGSGKTVGSRAMLGLLPDTAAITGEADLDGTNLVGLHGEAIRRVRGDRIACVFQEPSTALDPVRTVGWQLCEALLVHRRMSRKDALKRAVELLDLVGIPDPASRVYAYPHQLSGGQKQRVMIAMAISCDPEVIIADEPTTALDVTVQAQILDLLHDLRDKLGTAIILITHNMGVVADMADRVAVMYQGEIVEQGPARDIFERPQHPYTKLLLDAVPHLGQPRPAAMNTPA
ncbi:MAG: ABC transporter ATP-binding protein, partial [Actinomycetia bacterium]|nr:ABC transporter ATP-binding protein [Actinomycetes bacterium]